MLLPVSQENLGFYLKACWHLGVPSSDLFVTSDLYLSKDERQVWSQESHTTHHTPHTTHHTPHTTHHTHTHMGLRAERWNVMSEGKHQLFGVLLFCRSFRTFYRSHELQNPPKNSKVQQWPLLVTRFGFKLPPLMLFVVVTTYCSLSSLSKLQKSRPPNGLAP